MACGNLGNLYTVLILIAALGAIVIWTVSCGMVGIAGAIIIFIAFDCQSKAIYQYTIPLQLFLPLYTCTCVLI